MITEKMKEWTELTDDQKTGILQILIKDIEEERYSYMAGTLLISLNKVQFGLHVKEIFDLTSYFDIDLQYLVSKSYVTFRTESCHFYDQALKNMKVYESMAPQEILAYSEL